MDLAEASLVVLCSCVTSYYILGVEARGAEGPLLSAEN